MKWPGWLTGRRKPPPEPAQPDTPRRPELTTDPRASGGLMTLCPTYVAYPTGFQDLRHWRQMVAARHPEAHILASLDNVGQAGYTASHAIQTHGLDETDPHDLIGLPDGCFEDGAHIGYLSTPEEFPIRLANFRAGLMAAPQRVEKLSWRDPNDGIAIDEVNFDASAVVHAPGVIQAVPVTRSADAIAAFPNGYFSDDLTPFDLHRVVAELETLDYHLIAIGASYVALWGETYLTDAQIAARSQIVAGLYGKSDIDALNESLKGKRHLILRYTQ